MKEDGKVALRAGSQARQKEDDRLFDQVNRALYRVLPADQRVSVFSHEYCDIEPDFLGFVHIYKKLAEIIPRHFTVVDLGCAYAAQAFLFTEHNAYIGVDRSPCNRFRAANTTHYDMTIADYISQHGRGLHLPTTFAICSYVPPWHHDNQRLAREFFPNVFTYYPADTPISHPFSFERSEKRDGGAPHPITPGEP